MRVILGKSGTGKSVALKDLILRLRERGVRAIIHDPKGDITSLFYDHKKDIILNPLDKKSVYWNLFDEIKTYQDVDAMASSLIPETSRDPYWNKGARDVFIGILHSLYKKDLTTNANIHEMTTSTAEHLKSLFGGVRGAETGLGYLNMSDNKGLSRPAEIVLSVMKQYTRFLEYMMKEPEEKSKIFSLDDWIKNGEGFIFLTNHAEVRDTLNPLLSLFTDLLGRKLLSLPESLERKIFFILDEFGFMQRMPSMVDLLTNSRSKGGCIFLGIQDYAQIDRIYSREDRQSIVNSCSNSITFCLGDRKTARTASENIGQIEYEEKETIFRSSKKNKDVPFKKRVEPLFLPSDLMNLPDLEAVVKVHGVNGFVKSKWDYKKMEEVNKPFEQKEGFKMEEIHEKGKNAEINIDHIKNEDEQNSPKTEPKNEQKKVSQPKAVGNISGKSVKEKVGWVPL